MDLLFSHGGNDASVDLKRTVHIKSLPDGVKNQDAEKFNQTVFSLLMQSYDLHESAVERIIRFIVKNPAESVC